MLFIPPDCDKKRKFRDKIAYFWDKKQAIWDEF
jgi:hypothetical protein